MGPDRRARTMLPIPDRPGPTLRMDSQLRRGGSVTYGAAVIGLVELPNAVSAPTA